MDSLLDDIASYIEDQGRTVTYRYLSLEHNISPAEAKMVLARFVRERCGGMGEDGVDITMNPSSSLAVSVVLVVTGVHSPSGEHYVQLVPVISTLPVAISNLSYSDVSSIQIYSVSPKWQQPQIDVDSVNFLNSFNQILLLTETET